MISFQLTHLAPIHSAWICLELLKGSFTSKGSNHLGKASAETSVSSYLSLHRICLHLAGTLTHQRSIRPDQWWSPHGAAGCRNCFPNREVLKIQRGLKPIRPDPPVISSRPTGKNQDDKSRWWYRHSIHPVLFITMMIMRMRMRVRARV